MVCIRSDRVQSVGGTVSRLLECITPSEPNLALQILPKLTLLPHWKRFPPLAFEEKVIDRS